MADGDTGAGIRSINLFWLISLSPQTIWDLFHGDLFHFPSLVGRGDEHLDGACHVLSALFRAASEAAFGHGLSIAVDRPCLSEFSRGFQRRVRPHIITEVLQSHQGLEFG